MNNVLNSWPLYLIAGAVLLYVLLLSVAFLVRAWKAGLEIGLDRTRLKRAVISSVTFTFLPSFSILLGVVALAGALGVPLPWLRLSVIGALHYETSVADIAARSVGLSGLSAAEMTLVAFTTIALVMSAGIIWSMVFTVFFNKGYLARFRKKEPDTAEKSGKKGFGDLAMTAMFIGLVAAYIGSYAGTWKAAGDFMPLIVVCASGLAMAVFTWFVEKKKMVWLESFAMAGSMLFGMAVAVGMGVLL